MQILMVTNYFAPEGGAAAVRLTRLAKKLHRRGHQVTVLTSLPHYPHGRVHERYRGRFSVVDEVDGIRVVQSWLLATPSPRISRKMISQFTFMISAGLRGLGLPRPDVVLIEGQPIFTAIAGMAIATLKRRPYVLNVSDVWPEHVLPVALSERHPAYRVARRVVDLIYRRARAIVAMSPRWAEMIAGHLAGRPATITTICNGVDLETFRPGLDTAAFRQKYSLGEKKICSFIGTLATQYDLDVMVQVATRLGRDPRLQIVFIGQGSQGEALRRHLEQVADVRWIPWIDFAEVPLAWNASYVTFFALRSHPLYQGTIPAKLFEAMASGVPVLAAMDGVGAKIIEDAGAGVAVPCGDGDGLGRALEEVLGQAELRQRYALAARRYAEAHFDAEQVAAAYEATLAAAAAARSGPLESASGGSGSFETR